MKCKRCFKSLTKYYFEIAGKILCFDCARRIMADVDPYYVELNQTGGQTNERRNY